MTDETRRDYGEYATGMDEWRQIALDRGRTLRAIGEAVVALGGPRTWDDAPAFLRSLPVLPTCGDCGRWGRLPSDVPVCQHPGAKFGKFGTEVLLRDPPPSWCPLRGGGR